MSPGSDIRQRAKMLKEFGRKVMRHLRRHWKSFRTSTKPPGFFGGDISFTIVVPVFNTPAVFLSDCGRSVLSQTYRNWELILVDDASTEPLALSALADLSSKKNVRLFRHTSNRGLSAARNTGLLRATGEFVIFLDSDDFLYSDTLKAFADILQTIPPGVSGMVGRTPISHQDSRFRPTCNPNPKPEVQDRVIWREGKAENLATVHAVCARRVDLIRVGGFLESMRNGAEDYEFWDRFMRHGHTMLRTTILAGIYRQASSSMLVDGLQRHLESCEKIIERSQRDFDGLCHRRTDFPISSLGTQIADIAILKRSLRWLGIAHARGQRGSEILQLIEGHLTPTVPLQTDRASLEQAFIYGFKRGKSASPLSSIRDATSFAKAEKLGRKFVHRVFKLQEQKFHCESSQQEGIDENMLLIGFKVPPAEVKNRAGIYQLDTASLTEDMGSTVEKTNIRGVPTLSFNEVLLGFGNISVAVIPEKIARHHLGLLERLRTAGISIQHG